MAGCSSLDSTGDKGYVTGAGVVSQLAEAERSDPVELTGEDLEGRTMSLADLRGKPAVVVVWGSWCTPCRAEAPAVVAAAEELDREARFVGINIRDSAVEQGLAFARNQGIDWPSFYSPSGEALLAFRGALGPNAIPSFVVLDPSGRIAATIVGELPSTRTLVEVTRDAAGQGAAQGSGSADG